MNAPKLLTLALLCAAPLLHAQTAADTVKNKLDAKGRRQGEWKRVDQEGKTIFIGTFKDDKPIGTFKYFDSNGKLMTISHFAPDSKSCRSTHYDANEKKQGEGKYVNTAPGKWVKDSVWSFYNPLGDMVSQETYVKGLMEGPMKVYYPGTKQVSLERTYKNNAAHGPSREYFQDGKKKAESNYVNGKMEGKAVWYNAEGGMSVLGNYKNDFKEGVFIYYNVDGSEKFRQTYVKGKLQGDEPLITPEEMQKRKREAEEKEQLEKERGGQLPGGGGW